ncbi:MAG: hypothetical protein GTO40_13245 [Deltaproteobacteria bacterium]|nr:hypothetical protein [Deltaproteobacteria bacterium]
MAYLDTFAAFLQGAAIAPWEAFAFSLLSVVFLFMGLYHSFLLGTFVFTYYWGFKNLLQMLSSQGASSESLVLLYVACGIFLLLVTILKYFAKPLRRAFICPPV